MEIDNLRPLQRVSGQLTLEPRLVGVEDPERAMDHYEIFMDGRRMMANRETRRFRVDTTGLADGWHELRIVAVAADPVRRRAGWCSR